MSKKSIKSDLARVDRMKDAEIDYSDIPALDKSFLKKAAVAWPPVKKQLKLQKLIRNFNIIRTQELKFAL